MGGAEFTLYELATHLDPSLYIPHLLVSGQGLLANRFRAAEIQVYTGDFPFFRKRYPWIYLQAIIRMVLLIKRQRISLVQVNCDRAVPHSVLASRLAHVPCICYIHDMLRAWYLPSYVRSLNRANRIIVDSEATAARCRAVGMDGSKLSVIYECFDQERYKAATSASSREHFRSEYGIPNNVIAIGLVGQILKHKGQEEFIHAAKTVASEYPNVHFFVVGDDSMSSDKEFLPFLSRLVTELGLEKKITFTGFLSDIPQVMAGLDIVAVPSREEAFGRVIVEAIASGRPVVASNTGGILEIVQEGVTGQLFPVKDHEALAECLLRLCRDEDLRTAMGRRGPASVARFDVRSHVQQFAALYRGLVPGDFSL